MGISSETRYGIRPQALLLQFVVAAVNNPREAVAGNVRKFDLYSQACADAGWVCVVVDTNSGKPRTMHATSEAIDLKAMSSTNRTSKKP